MCFFLQKCWIRLALAGLALTGWTREKSRIRICDSRVNFTTEDTDPKMDTDLSLRRSDFVTGHSVAASDKFFRSVTVCVWLNPFIFGVEIGR